MKNYEKHHRSLRAQAGARTVWALPNPSEMTITKIVVVQTGGAAAAFTIDLFNSKRVLAGSQSSGGEDPDGAYSADPDLYRVYDTIPADSPGKLKRFFTDGNGINFSNQDGGSTNKERKIYVEIEVPAGTGDETFDVAIGGWSDVG